MLRWRDDGWKQRKNNKGVSVEFHVEADTVILLAGGEDASGLEECFEQIALIHEDLCEPVRIDFSRLDGMSSHALLVWIRLMEEKRVPILYANVPVWFTDHLASLKDLLANGSKVESIQAPFYHKTREETVIRTLQVGKDIPLLDDYDALDATTLVQDPDLEPDFDLSGYFSFLARTRT